MILDFNRTYTNNEILSICNSFCIHCQTKTMILTETPLGKIISCDCYDLRFEQGHLIDSYYQLKNNSFLIIRIDGIEFKRTIEIDKIQLFGSVETIKVLDLIDSKIDKETIMKLASKINNGEVSILL